MQVCTEQKQDEHGLRGTGRPPVSFCICKDLGIDCSYVTTGTTRNEVMRKFIEHAGSVHNMDVLTADIIYRVQKAIQK